MHYNDFIFFINFTALPRRCTREQVKSSREVLFWCNFKFSDRTSTERNLWQTIRRIYISIRRQKGSSYLTESCQGSHQWNPVRFIVTSQSYKDDKIRLYEWYSVLLGITMHTIQASLVRLIITYFKQIISLHWNRFRCWRCKMREYQNPLQISFHRINTALISIIRVLNVDVHLRVENL